MARIFCIPGIILLFAATVLLFVTSISLPFLPALDIVRIHTGSDGAQVVGKPMTETRLGVWAFCYYDKDGSRTCSPTHHAYSASFSNGDSNAEQVIGSSWTRGLAALPVATGVTFIAFLLSFSQHLTVTLVASLVSFLAALITFICFLIEIALFAFVHHKVGEIPGFDGNTNTAPGFWLTFVSFILLLLAGCTVCFGRRRDKAAGTYPAYPTSTEEKPSFFSRFRRS